MIGKNRKGGLPMIETHGLIEYLLAGGGDLRDRESLTARQIKRFTDEMPGGLDRKSVV